jgi:hypothetical protein
MLEAYHIHGQNVSGGPFQHMCSNVQLVSFMLAHIDEWASGTELTDNTS